VTDRPDPADTTEFLRRHAPFDRMSDAALAFAVPRLEEAQYPKDATLVSSQTGPVTHLHIVRSGLVGNRPDGVRTEHRTLGPGALFPIGSLSAGGSTTKLFWALEDTRCYLLARADFLQLREMSPEFERYCMQAVTETLKQSLESLQGQYSQRIADQQLLTRTLAELLRHAPVACSASTTLHDAAQKMADAKVRTIVALDDAGRPVGIFTLVDLLRRVVLPGRAADTPLSQVMTAPLVSLPAAASASEAMHVMAERGVRQVAVVENGKLRGVINERDLFALQRVSLRQVNEQLREADSIGGLRAAVDDIRRLTENLLVQGVGSETLTRTITLLNDALSRRLIELSLRRHDLSGIDWCWLALGSEGRGEQTLATDQDNALLFAAADAAAASSARTRLLAFAQDVNSDLDTLGFPLCPGKVMAGNPEMCLSFDEWKAKFLAWIYEPTPEALLNANIVFDFRALYGDGALCDRLRSWLFANTRDASMFLRFMVQNALDVEPPLGLIRTFTVDDEAAVKGTLDLKTRGTRLFVDCARIFSLALGIAETGTAARLRRAGQQMSVTRKYVDATIDAFHFLQLLRLRQQGQPAVAGNANRIDPAALNEIDQRMLKEAFRQARQLQERLRLTYRL
jgi:CBS domain-containing protein